MVGEKTMRTSLPRLALIAAPLVLGVAGLACVGTGGSGTTRLGASSEGLGYVHTIRASETALPAVGTPASAAATWCGSPTQADLQPNTLAGFPVHWIYATPSDGQDRFATFAHAMQTDAEAIDAWWRREDPTRTLRNDLTQLSCGLQLDLTTMRFPLSGSQLADGGRFGAIFDALESGSFRSSFTKYLVYYDGPVGNDDICGQGGSSGSGMGLAVVYVQACTGVSVAGVAAHELLHTFGSVPDGAPHDCPSPNDGHTCDTTSDLMYPFIDGQPLSSKLLDPGGDDYYAHAAGFTDAQDSPWLVQLDRQLPLAVTITGPGDVTADVPGLRCGETCTTTWNANTRLILTAAPRPGQKLVRWGGACSGASTCNVTVAQGSTVTALFAPVAFRLSVSVGGRGTVKSSRSGITCRPRCAASFPSFVPVRLTAAPAKGWKLRSWTGACKGNSRSCNVPMTAAASARAVFVRA
jgi:hypothetical protein